MPAGLGRRFLVFVDTEEEFDWSASRRRDAVATSAIASLPQAHGRLRGFGISPTYLVDYPVASADSAVTVLRSFLDAGECAIGAQLHPWVNPPFEEELSDRNSFAGNLPEALERAKLEALTSRIADSFGRRPTVYRAGRYGIGPNSARLLEEAGYRLDTSVRALFDYRDEGGPDFSLRTIDPCWAGPGRLLIELPLTAMLTGRARRLGAARHAATIRLPPLRALLARSGLLQRVALTPEGTPLRDAVEAVRLLADADVRLISISFHSPSIVPGHTPYVRDAADLRRFWAWWDGVLDALARAGFAPLGVDALITALWAARDIGPALASAGSPPYRRATGGL